jgi:hypothetical protein
MVLIHLEEITAEPGLDREYRRRLGIHNLNQNTPITINFNTSFFFPTTPSLPHAYSLFGPIDTHSQDVARIASRVRAFYEQKQAYHIHHGSTYCTRKSTKTTANTVDTSSLCRILNVDPVNRVIQIEPNVAMDQLVEATYPIA